jgi:pimeloyl-ACP methyl ester carboxylesterase
MGYRLHGAVWPALFVDRLAQRFSVLTFDNRGTGLSDKPAQAYDMHVMAADVAGLLDALGFSKAHVLGFSMGGAVAQEFALRHPQRLDRLVLFATFPGLGFGVPAPWPVLRRLFDNEGLPPEDAARQAWPVTYSPEYLTANPDTVEAQMRREVAHPTPDHVARAQRQALGSFSSSFRLWRMRAATLVATGGADEIVPPANSWILTSFIPRARLAVLPGLGHRAIWEAPGQAADLVSEFLHPSTSSPNDRSAFWF